MWLTRRCRMGAPTDQVPDAGSYSRVDCRTANVGELPPVTSTRPSGSRVVAKAIRRPIGAVADQVPLATSYTSAEGSGGSIQLPLLPPTSSTLPPARRTAVPRARAVVNRPVAAQASMVVAGRGVTVLDDTENGPRPSALMAATWKLTGAPLGRPPSVAGESATVKRAPEEARTRWPVTSDPPSSSDGNHASRTDRSLAIASRRVGASGSPPVPEPARQ